MYKRSSWDREGTGTASEGRHIHLCEPEKRRTNFYWTSVAKGDGPSEGIMFVSDEEVTALRAKVERAKKELERAKKELERAKWEKELQKRAYEAEIEWFQYEAELEGLQSDRMGMPMFPKYEAEIEWLRYGAELGWLQSDRMGMPMFPLSEGPQQLAPTAVALAGEGPTVEVTTDTRVFPDTAAPDSSVERATTKLTSAARLSSKIGGERRASTGTLVQLSIRYNNNNSSSSNNDTTTTCAVALLRPFDPGKGFQRDARIGAVIGLDLPFDRGKA